MAEQLTLQSVSALLTPQILQDAVQKIYEKKFYSQDIVQIVKTDVALASAKGDGFLGIIYRIRATLANGTELRLIGKGMPANVVRRKTFQCEKWFAREIQFYNVVCPAFMKLGAKFVSVPDCYYALSDGENDFMLLEDLVESGYQMADKGQGLNTIQTISIVKMMARFHALSLSMKVLQPEKYLEITECIQVY
jgi:Ecdysteroid kinase-like family